MWGIYSFRFTSKLIFLKKWYLLKEIQKLLIVTKIFTLSVLNANIILSQNVQGLSIAQNNAKVELKAEKEKESFMKEFAYCVRKHLKQDQIQKVNAVLIDAV